MKRGRGFTLIEAVVVISVIGVLAVLGALVIKPAIDGYFDQQRRAELSDVADTAARRVARDLRLALPNSVRVDAGTGRVVEFLLTKNGGRYRAEQDDDTPAATTENILDFTVADNQFDTLGLLSTASGQLVQANDYVVVHNLGISGADAYAVSAATPNIAQISGYASGGGALPNEDRISLTGGGVRFPLESPGRRFFVVSGAVSFACVNPGLDANGNGTGTLERWSGYAFADTTAAPAPNAFPGGVNALLANRVSSCTIQYAPLALQSRGLVSINLELSRGGTAAKLYFEVHVSNVP